MKTALVLAIAMFVIVPLGLRLANRPSTGPTTKLLGPLRNAAPLFAVPATVSLLLDQGVLAAVLALPWFLFTVAIAAIGMARRLTRHTLRSAGVGVDAGLVFIAVGGMWLVLSRAGLRPMGFSDAIVELTAVHFHYAGFALPIMASMVSNRLGHGALLPTAITIGVPVTAIGIMADGIVEFFAATFMALVGFVVAYRTLQSARTVGGVPRVLLAISGLSLAAGMSLAIGWAWSQEFGWTYLDLDGMVATHGMLNGFGFALVGLIAFNVMADDRADFPQEVCLHVGRPSEGRLAELQTNAVTHEPTNPVGILNGPTPEHMQFRVWRKTFEHDDFERAKAAIRNWAGHERAGIARYPNRPPIEVGESLALAIPVGPISVSATARIVEVFDESDRYGFSYSTLPHHPEDGEESFIVHRLDDGTLEMVVTAMWHGAAIANRVLPPLTTWLQNRAINLYLDGTAEWSVTDLPVADLV